MVEQEHNIAKDILDKYAVDIVTKEGIYLNKEDEPQVAQKKGRYTYTERKYKGDEVLWIAPTTWLRAEFEESHEQNRKWIREMEQNCKSLGIDYCITEHEGAKSPYLNICNIKNIPLTEDNQIAKLLLFDLLMPQKAKDQLDRTNLGRTLSPVIGHPHWKPKYKGAIHKIIRGTNPLEQKNEYPKELLKQLKKSKEAHKKYIITTKQSSVWVEDFLLKFCCENELPKGARHFVIEKNLAAFIIHRKDKEEIKSKYYTAQKRKHDSLKTWELAILKGDFTNVSAGELAKFIKDYSLPFEIPKQKDIEESKKEEEIEIDQNLLEISSEKFKEPELIINIHNELSKKHLLDDGEKLTSFIGCCTAYLEPAELHKSQAYIGSSSVGKDNIIKSTLSLFPKKDWIFLTNASQATMEDDIQNYKIIAYSEMNFGRDDGANLHLIETLKQMTEGGTSSMKKDLATGYKTTKHIKQEQKTVLYGTTESECDEELETRFVKLGIKGHETKTRKVNENTFKWFSGKQKEDKPSSWVAAGISCLEYNKVIIPYAEELKEQINGKDIFDHSNSRSMRDVKRLLSYTSGVAWLYQKQRQIQDGYIISEPFDFILAVIICSKFFNQTYTGLGDIRLQSYLDYMKLYEAQHLGCKDIPRNEIQGALRVSRSTVKRYSGVLSDLGLIKRTRYENNILYYERCPEAIQKVLIGCSVKELKKHLESSKGIQINQEYCNVLKKIEEIVENEVKEPKKVEKKQEDSTSEKNGHPVLDTLNIKQQVLDYLKNNPKTEESEISKSLNIDYDKVIALLDMLSGLGDVVENPKGRWSVLN